MKNRYYHFPNYEVSDYRDDDYNQEFIENLFLAIPNLDENVKDYIMELAEREIIWDYICENGNHDTFIRLGVWFAKIGCDIGPDVYYFDGEDQDNFADDLFDAMNDWNGKWESYSWDNQEFALPSEQDAIDGLTNWFSSLANNDEFPELGE